MTIKPLLICSFCNCIDNTATTNFWSKVVLEGQLPLCSLCDPDIKAWHGRFDRRSASFAPDAVATIADWVAKGGPHPPVTLTPPGFDAVVTHAVYDHPADTPDSIVVRRWFSFSDGIVRPCSVATYFPEIENAREYLFGLGLSRIGRMANDDPAIAEVWL